MSMPPNFSSTRFALAYGDEAYDRQMQDAEARAADTIAAARTLKNAAQAFLTAVQGLEFTGPVPTSGYDIAEIVEVVRDAASIDLAAFKARLIEDAREGV